MKFIILTDAQLYIYSFPSFTRPFFDRTSTEQVAIFVMPKMELSTIAKNNSDKSIDRASFKYKLNEIAAFAEAILSGDNQSFKTELTAKIGDIREVCLKRVYSSISDSDLFLDYSFDCFDFPPNKRARREIVKIELPDEMWIKILGFLGQKDVYKSFALTCKRFYKLSLDPSINRSLQLRRIDEIDQEHVINVLKRSQFLTHIRTENCQSFVPLIKTSLESCPKLKSIEIENSFRNTQGQSLPLSNVLAKMGKNLERLCITDNRLYITKIAIKTLQNLKYLQMGSISKFTSVEVLALANTCKQLETLSVSITYDMHTKRTFKYLINEVSGTLKYLKINAGYSSNFPSTWPKYLARAHNLETIEIIGSISIDSLTTGITNLFGLKHLTLQRQRGSLTHSPNAYTNLFTNLNMKEMEDLNLIGVHGLTRENLIALANRECPKMAKFCFHMSEKAKFDEEILRSLIINAPNLKSIHAENVDLSNDQLHRIQHETGVYIGVSSDRKRQLDKYISYNRLENIEKINRCKCRFMY